MYSHYIFQYSPHVPIHVSRMLIMYGGQNCLQTALPLIQEAIYGEREDELFYEYVINIAPTQEDKNVIVSIRDDERKHNQMFRNIFKDFTGKEIQVTNEEQFPKPDSYINGLKQALFGEWRAVEKYRIIKQCLPQGVYQDILFEIITDELKHASKYNYLLTLNSTMLKP